MLYLRGQIHERTVFDQMPALESQDSQDSRRRRRSFIINRPDQSEEMEGNAASPPPSPPESVAETTRITIAACPKRITPMIPPENYGAVERGIIFRSSFPHWHNIQFLETLKLRSMITLVEAPLSSELQVFLNLYGVKHARVLITPNKAKSNKHTELGSLCEALLFIMNPNHHPVHIHCNRGKHRTGCVVACLRKIQQWPMDEILAEYEAYALPKARPEDVEFIKAFNPACVYNYAEKHGMLKICPNGQRHDSAVDVWELATSIPSHEPSPIRKDHKEEISADEDLTMKKSSPTGSKQPARAAEPCQKAIESRKSSRQHRSRGHKANAASTGGNYDQGKHPQTTSGGHNEHTAEHVGNSVAFSTICSAPVAVAITTTSVIAPGVR